jgi:hypothetical protein
LSSLLVATKFFHAIPSGYSLMNHSLINNGVSEVNFISFFKWRIYEDISALLGLYLEVRYNGSVSM